MKLVTFRQGARSAAGILRGNEILSLRTTAVDVGELLERRLPIEMYERADTHALGDVELLAPVLRPSKVIGAGLNYRAGCAALGEPEPQFPMLFHKTAAALTGAGSAIVIPPNTSLAVPEGELAVIMGQRATRIASADIDRHIAGYTCANDVSARDLEFRTSQWTSGKMLDTYCPLGPALVTPDEIDDPEALEIRTVLNGKLIQNGHTSDMIFGVRELVSEISFLVTLEIGDVILTGTPSDVGQIQPPIFLKPGDAIHVDINGVGVLENSVTSLRVDQPPL